MNDVERMQYMLAHPHPPTKNMENSIDTMLGRGTLRPVQKEALAKIATLRKCFISAGVGHGKTLISLLSPVVARSSRALLIIPSNLVEQLTKFEIPKYEKLLNIKFDWACIQGKSQHQRRELMNKHRITIFPYSYLSTEDTFDLLEASNADMIICDECQNLKNPKTPRTKRLLKYVDRYKPDLVFMSGTVIKKSLLDYHHLITRCLGTMSPLPHDYQHLVEVQNAIRYDTANEYEYCRYLTSVDRKLAEGGGYLVKVEDARRFVKKCFDTTLGTIRTEDQSVECSMSVDIINVTMDRLTMELTSELAELWKTPDGDEIEDAIVFYACMSQLLSGFYYKLFWRKGTPEYKIKAHELHNVLKKNIRVFIGARHRDKLDTPKVVRKSLEAREKATKSIQLPYDDYFNYLDGRDPGERDQKMTTTSDYRMKYAAKWAATKKHGIIWYKWKCLGVQLLDAIPGSTIFDEENPTKGGIVLCSFAHTEGKNLQHQSNNLLYNFPASGAQMEQLMGRTHRQGQTADCVNFDIMLANEFEENQLKGVIRQARFLDSVVNKQKILLADWVDTSLL